MTMSTRIGVMSAGRIVQIGAPDEIYEQPRSRFVADFVGTINLFEGRVARVGSAGAVLALADGVELAIAQKLAVGAAACIGLRPEKLMLSRAPAAAGLNALAGVIQDVAYLGGLSSYHVRLDGGAVVRVTAPNQERRTDDRLAVGERVQVAWRPEAAVVLDS